LQDPSTTDQLDSAALLGSVLDGRYRIEQVIGHGANAIVYRARQTLMNKDVVIKLMTPGIGESYADHFQRQVAAAKSLEHPNIARIYATGLIGGDRPYLAMEYVQGSGLDAILKGGAIPWAKALEIFIGICEGMQYAHENNVVHRDIKPANIMLRSNAESDPQEPATESIVILDFGLASVYSEKEGKKTKLTRTTVGMPGTPMYMSPEVCQKKTADARSDIYAIGCLMYEVLTGVPPFTGDSAFDLMYKHIHQVPARFPTATLVPTELEKIVQRCMNKNPDERFQTAAQLGAALRECRGSISRTAPSAIIPGFEQSQIKAAGKALLVIFLCVISFVVISALIMNDEAVESMTMFIASMQQPNNLVAQYEAASKLCESLGKPIVAQTLLQRAADDPSITRKHPLRPRDVVHNPELLVQPLKRMELLHRAAGLMKQVDARQAQTSYQQVWAEATECTALARDKPPQLKRLCDIAVNCHKHLPADARKGDNYFAQTILLASALTQLNRPQEAEALMDNTIAMAVAAKDISKDLDTLYSTLADAHLYDARRDWNKDKAAASAHVLSALACFEKMIEGKQRKFDTNWYTGTGLINVAQCQYMLGRNQEANGTIKRAESMLTQSRQHLRQMASPREAAEREDLIHGVIAGVATNVFMCNKPGGVNIAKLAYRLGQTMTPDVVIDDAVRIGAMLQDVEGNQSEAYQYIAEGLELAKNHPSTPQSHLVMLWYSMAKCLTAQHRYSEALPYVLQANAAAKQSAHAKSLDTLIPRLYNMLIAKLGRQGNLDGDTKAWQQTKKDSQGVAPKP
jgi:serine/threonine protein kinase/tetratricopeptide (TPR) repeat protein